MIKLFQILLFVLISLSAVSQNVVITGEAKGQPNKIVRVIVYSDQFSNMQKTIAQTATNKQGEFNLKLNVTETQFAFLAFGLEKGEFYLSPNATYHFNIFIDTASVNESIFDKLPLNFTLVANDGGIQQSIEDYNLLYNDFVFNNVNSIYKSRNKIVVTNFVDSTHQKYKNDNNKYVKDYVDYSLAWLLWLSRKENNTKVLEKYFVNKPVLYNNIQFTDFFKDFFKNYFDTEKLFTYNELIFAINDINTSELHNLLVDKTTFAIDVRISELVEMLLLKKNYHNRDAVKKQVLLKLKYIADKSKFSENKLIANNFIHELQIMQNGTPAPEIFLQNSNNDTVLLSSFKGNFVLLNFVKPNCKICDFQMQLLNDIKEQGGNKFDIITIVAGNNFTDIANYAKSRGYDWQILKTGDDILVFENYNIKTYPTYMLLNPDGTFAYAHLPMPNENMELYINRFIEKYKK